ncbi:serine hydrolase [Bacillus sp. FSL K6-3431]|uniref:serine hydrolase n=1 Tax=Bacillus sp. FSL K6-3431 TaxID=2921500 RepID=UPI0030F7060A
MPDLTMSVEAIQKKVDDYCSALSKVGYLTGSVLVTLEENILISKGYGNANFEHRVANTPQTIFRIGSITKQFTAMAIMILYERGLLNLYDPIKKFISDYPNGDQINIHHLLTHTSGVPNFTDFPDYLKTARSAASIESIIGRFKEKPLDFSPGENHKYSNSGYILLTYIIERVANCSYESFLEHEIFKPLSMLNTGYDSNSKILKHRAAGYSIWGEIINAEFVDTSLALGAGGLYSTTEDLYRWVQSLNESRLISKDSFKKMVTPNIGKYGYGIYIAEKNVKGKIRTKIGHGGMINGFCCEMMHYVDDYITIIVLSNVQNPVGSIIASLEKIVYDESYDLPINKPEITIGTHQRNSCIGKYKVNNHVIFEVSEEKDKLYLSFEPWFKYELYPTLEQVGRLIFATRLSNGEVNFHINSKGEITQLGFNLYGNMDAKKVYQE